MSDQDWSFWRSQLADEDPATTPGVPHSGYFIQRSYVSLPHSIPTKKNSTSVHRPLCEFPVAIWMNGDEWIARASGLGRDRVITGTDAVDELFARVCRQPISYERYQEMVKTIEEWRVT